ncbi:hypothetical protein BO99DRAFT_459851 [Aspergillus violaceofuscus CBS 115571]|uniref:Uncharacterized protein n=1 Tax=Aspergillus violaceofuscus (strain CBS 115571) TaxID=1450538 RepID=A0A2V5HRS3_ASPV1|nr:hypothetical protein BO99DRAFT_459851 [Aspergillus violaceofuscus CBS 115571]
MHQYLKWDQRRYPCLAGVPWTERSSAVCLPDTPILSVVRFNFRPDVNLTDSSHVTFVLWEKSLAFVSSIPGFRRLHWALLHNEPQGVIVLLQWQHGDAWREFQSSFGFGLILPLLQEKPLLNRCLQLTLPPTFAAGSDHFLELANLSLLVGLDTQWDAAEAQRKIETEWTSTVQGLANADPVAPSATPKLLCSIGGWVERDLPAESPNFVGLFLWRSPSSADLVNHSTKSQTSWLGPDTQIIEMSTLLTGHLRQYNPVPFSTKTAGSLQPFSSTILAKPIAAPQYTFHKGLSHTSGWDSWGSQSYNGVDSGQRICPSPSVYWCPMGAMSQHGFPSVGDIWPRQEFPTSLLDVVWLQVDETHPGIFQILRDLRLAIYDSLGCPILCWGREIGKARSQAKTSQIGLLIKWVSSRNFPALARLDQLIQEAVATAAGAIQPLSAVRYCAVLPTKDPCRLELFSIYIPNDECHKRLLWYAYHRYQYSMLPPRSGRASLHVRPSPDYAAHHYYQGFHKDEVTDVGQPPGNGIIRFSACTSWLNAEARAEWYADFAHQAAHQYERLGYIIDWFQTLAVSADCLDRFGADGTGVNRELGVGGPISIL